MKTLSIASLVVLTSLTAQIASAQVANGTFTAPPIPPVTGTITDWNTSVGAGGSGGHVSVSFGPNPGAANDGPPIPVPGTNEVLVVSTGNAVPAPYTAVYGGAGNAVLVGSIGTAGTLDNFLNTTLPPSANGTLPINGEAIQQTFASGLGGGKVSFYYAYESREAPGGGGFGTDETGYVLNGTFTILADTQTNVAVQLASHGSADPNLKPYGFFAALGGGWALPYTQDTITVGPGSDTLGFVAYNTLNAASPSGLFLDDIVFIPLFGTVPGLTPNQQAVANYIDSVDTTTDPNFNALLGALAGAPSVAVLGGDLDQLSPQSLQVFRHIAFDNATFTTLDVNNHLANLRDGLTGFDGSQLSVNDPGLSSGVSNIKRRLRDPKDMNDPKEMADTKEMASAYAPMSLDPWSTFISGNVILADLSHDQDLAHQDYTSGSVMLGMDYRLDDHWTVGALFAYSHTDVNLDEIGSTATVDSYSPGIYASYVDGGWYGNALFAYGFNSYTEDRNISIGTFGGANRGAPEGNQYTGSLTGGYEFRDGDLKYGPIAGIQYVNLGINSFTENGPTALNVQSESDESFRSQLGFEARYVVHTGSICLIPHSSATWQHEFLDNNNGITSQFNSIGTGAFTVQTTKTERDSAVIDVGLDADVARNVTLFTDYQTEAGEDHYSAQSVQAGVKVSF